MIQQMFNMMMGVFLARFMLNDVPHLLDRVEAAPEPVFMSHSTAAWEEVLRSGVLKPLGAHGPGETVPYVPFSLDGMWTRYVGNSHWFKLDVRRVINLPSKPVLYLGTGGSISIETYANYDIMDIATLWATEVKVLIEVPVSEKDMVVGEPPPTPLWSYLQPTIPYLKQTGKEALIEYKPPPFIPPNDVAEIVHGYNRMVCRLFRIDYEALLARVAADIGGAEDWVRWW